MRRDEVGAAVEWMEPAGSAFYCDREGRVLRFVRDILGFSERLPVGESWKRLLDEGSVEKADYFWAELMEKRAVFEWELGVLTAKGVEILLFGGVVLDREHLLIAARTNEDLVGLLEDMARIGNEQMNLLRKTIQENIRLKASRQRGGLYAEVTRLNSEMVSLHRSLAKKVAQLGELNEEKNRIIGVVAHDLRGPLGNIHALASLLEDGGLDPERREIVGFIKEESARLMALVGDLLDMASLERGRLALRAERADLVDVVRRAVRRQMPWVERKGMEVRLELPESAEGVFDADRVGQAVDNYLSNAVKYGPSFSRVTVRVRGVEGGWRLEVEDEGPGIPEEAKPGLFRPFQTAGSRVEGEGKSTGLGLFIVRRVLEAHGGRVGVERGEGGGALFWFELPGEAVSQK